MKTEYEEIPAHGGEKTTRVFIDWEAKTIDLWWSSHRSHEIEPGPESEPPYYVNFDRLDETDWFEHLARKNWMCGNSLAAFALAQCKVRDACNETN